MCFFVRIGAHAIKFTFILFTFLLICYANAAESSNDRLEELKMVLAEVGYAIPSDEILLEVLEIDRISKQGLTQDGLIASTKFVANAKGTMLSKNTPSCFTCSMRVLTPEGYVEIQNLSAGDEVLSWDVKNKKYIKNQITRIHQIKNQLIGELHSSEALRPIEVTPLHRFYRTDTKEYEPISKISPNSPLLGFNVNVSCKSFFKPRSMYKNLNSLKDVFNLSLKKSPHNFIVEGVLVHNVKFGA